MNKGGSVLVFGHEGSDVEWRGGYNGDEWMGVYQSNVFHPYKYTV